MTGTRADSTVLAASSAKVTVVMLTYNHAAFVEEALRSVLGQVTDFDVDVVVRDDASTDATPRILRDVAAEYPGRVQLILEERNQLSLGAFGLGNILPLLRSPLVAFCEGDDAWADSGKLQKQVGFMEANPWCAISHHDVVVVNEGGDADYESALGELLSPSWRRAERVPGRRLVDGNFLMTVSVMIRRSAIRDEVLHAARDVHPLDFVIFALASESGDIGFVPDTLARYRLHANNFWSHMDEDERNGRLVDAMWFLGAHLRGSQRDAFREVCATRCAPLAAAAQAAAAQAAAAQAAAALADLQAERARQLAALDDRLQRAQHEVDSLVSQLAVSTSAALTAQEEARSLRSSTSWRLTSPLRGSKDLLLRSGLLREGRQRDEREDQSR